MTGTWSMSMNLFELEPAQEQSRLEQIDVNILIYFFKQYLQLSSYHTSGKKVIGQMKVNCNFIERKLWSRLTVSPSKP